MVSKMKDTKKYIVVHAAGAYICNDNGIRIDSSQQTMLVFDTLSDAKEHCYKVVKRLPFIQCHIKCCNHDETLLLTHLNFKDSISISNPNFKGLENVYKQALGKYSIQLYHCLTRGLLNPDGTYCINNQKKPIIAYDTIKEAKKYCKLITKKYNYVNCWIYGPDGKVIFRGGIDVILHESGEYTIPVKKPWWKFW